MKIEGTCDPKFTRVRDAFAANFESFDEVGAAVTAFIDGRSVVDLWGGYADKARTRPWTRDTLVNIYSTTKGLAATCAHRLVDQGKLDLDAPVARYWPEFAQGGKEEVPVRFILSHRAGLPAVRKRLPRETFFQWDKMCAALAEQEPWWEPGANFGYHPITFAWLVGEVVRRASGRTLGTYFREEIAQPLGLDAHIGLEAKHDARTADIIGAPPPKPGEPNQLMEMLRDPESMAAKSITNPPINIVEDANSREWRGMELPSANGHATARAVARAYAALARDGEIDGYRVLKPESIVRCYTEQSAGIDLTMKMPGRIGLGFMLNSPETPMGPNPHPFGHPGAGGSIGFADPDAKVGFAYVMNQMSAAPPLDPRPRALIEAFYACL